jgi:hypothetical protein
MTPQEESAARKTWAEAKRRKSRGRVAKMLAIKREREEFASVPASQRRWCVRTCRWIAEART